MIALSVYLPRLASDLERRRSRVDPSCVVLLSREERQRELVAACCELGERAGVVPGMSLSHARALVRGALHVGAFDAGLIGRALRRLGERALRFTPRAAPDAPDGLLLDATGCAHLFGGVEEMTRRVVGHFERAGLAARAAAAPCFGAAWALARFGASRACVVGAGGVEGALGPLPIAALRLSAGQQEPLREVGVRTVGELLRMPRGELAARAGAEVLRRIDQALGRRAESITPIVVRPEPMACRVLAGPTDRPESIDLCVRELLVSLCAGLERRGAGCREMRLTLLRPRLAPVEVVARAGAPSRDRLHWHALLRPGLERAHLGHGVEGLTLHARGLRRLGHRQASRWLDPARGGGDGELAKLTDTLVARLGPGRVLRMRARASHIPERSFVLEAAGGEPDSAMSAPTPARATSPSSATAISTRLPAPPPERTPAALAPSAPNAGGTSPARTAYSDIADRFRTAAGAADLRRPEGLRPARTGPDERESRAAREPRPTRAELETGASSANRNNPNAPLKGEDPAQTELRLLRQRLAGLRADAERQAAQPIDAAPRLRLDLAGTPTRPVDPSKPAPLPGEEFLPSRNRNPEQAPPRPRTEWDVYADQQLTKALQSMRQGERLKSLLSADAEKNLPDYAKLMTDAAAALSAGRYFDAETLYTRAMFISPDPLSATAGDVMARVGRVHAQLGAGLTMSSATALRALFIDHPEMLPVRYDPAAILPAKRAEALAQELSLEMGKGMTALGDESAFLLAYLGFQFDNQTWLDEGLKRMKLRASDMDLARAEQALAARRIWGNEKTEPDQPRPAEPAPAPAPAPDTNK
ncbi:MAG: hypothetical protein IBJ18_12920 [Phycisphaerales bacterium]|nr:hypothetical protein [Phycisphaerales bacterium]